MSKIIGIDLGTTNSAFAYMVAGKPEVITNSEGDRTTPSVVAVTKKGDRLVGKVAQRQRVTNPKNTIYGIKRLIGRKFDDKEVQRDLDIMPYKIVKKGNGVAVEMDGKEYTPEEISAMVLSKIKADAEAFLGEKVTEAIVADVSNEEVIRELDVKKFDAIILGMSSHFEDLVLALTLLKQEGAAKVLAKAGNQIQERILYRLGADEVIQPEQDVAERLSRRLSLDNISDFFAFKGSAIAEVMVPEALSGQSLRQLDLRNRYNITVLLIRKPGGSPESIWNPDTILDQGDQLTVFGNQKSIIELFKN